MRALAAGCRTGIEHALAPCQSQAACCALRPRVLHRDQALFEPRETFRRKRTLEEQCGIADPARRNSLRCEPGLIAGDAPAPSIHSNAHTAVDASRGDDLSPVEQTSAA